MMWGKSQNLFQGQSFFFFFFLYGCVCVCVLYPSTNMTWCLIYWLTKNRALDETSSDSNIKSDGWLFSPVEFLKLGLNIRHFLTAMMKWRQVLNGKRLRWVLVADEICFTSKVMALFFSLGKAIPVIRGEGIYQTPMDFALDKIDQGGWVHIFPEGIWTSILKILGYH